MVLTQHVPLLTALSAKCGLRDSNTMHMQCIYRVILDYNQVVLERVPDSVPLDKITEIYPDACNVLDFRHDSISAGYVQFEDSALTPQLASVPSSLYPPFVRDCSRTVDDVWILVSYLRVIIWMREWLYAW